MNNINSIKQKSFKFINEFDSTDKSYYIINITVKELIYSDGKLYYDIGYKYEFNGVETSRNKIHPFNQTTYIDELYFEGVVVYKNKMTEIMTEYLLAEPEELSKVSGLSTHQYYRTTIITNLARLWD